ncbi:MULTISPECIES: NAD-dependent epimerase/dehydratase family protein [unclassified Ensifer]|uniref:NAD-dependent epimerase/dehydratase family protein n=1 Tax=unclassified Ensifer TaxID=2633371 RepID=UPI00070C1BA3|nr:MULTISPECIES: NAD-dependent epimerase/dehydratase family protein [unclassified Ensifer]KQW50989.1 NAD-dependent dehydratase [Ensifer sp. Root1252]KRC54237.1 NAD-dependent dehydratase [Ensifer sp. Root231]KRD01571.1 NAD-dependent dehydratase [Ensifer sp. Root258]
MGTKDCILITGGAGFIGCELASLIKGFGLPIIALDNLHPQIHPTRSRPERLPDYVRLQVADICDGNTWTEFLTEWRPSIVVHLAAETGTGQSLTASSRHAETNVVGTTRMLDALSSANVFPDHILLSSSRAVYGEGAWHSKDGKIIYPGNRKPADLAAGVWSFRDEDGVELTPIRQSADSAVPKPISVYGATKLSQENILSAWCTAMNVPLSILRFQNVYGPGQAPFNAYTGIINIFYRIARSGAAIDVYEDGAIGRDFIFVDDVARACKAALERLPNGIRVLDVGTGIATTVLDAAREIAALNNAPAPEVSGKFRAGDVRWAVADTEDMRRQLNISASVSFSKGVQLLGDWLVGKGYA